MANFKTKDYMYFAFKNVTNNTACDLPQCAGIEDYIEIEYKAGKGHFKVLMYNLLCKFTITDFKKVVSMLIEDSNGFDKALTIHDLFVSMKAFLEKSKEHEKDKFDKSDAANIQAAIDKMTKFNDVLVDSFGIEPLTTEKQIKMHKTIVYKVYAGNQLVIDYDGKYFDKYGYRWYVTKNRDVKGKFDVIVPHFGLACASFHGNIRQAIEEITEELKDKIVDIVTKGKDDNKKFLELLQNAGIEEIPQFELKDSIDLVNETIENINNVTIEEFTKQFSWTYDLLYEAESVNDKFDYSKDVLTFDLYQKDMKDLLKAYIEYNGDFISSDREAAAFIQTIEHFRKLNKKQIVNTTLPVFDDIEDRIKAKNELEYKKQVLDIFTGNIQIVSINTSNNTIKPSKKAIKKHISKFYHGAKFTPIKDLRIVNHYISSVNTISNSFGYQSSNLITRTINTGPG